MWRVSTGASDAKDRTDRRVCHVLHTVTRRPICGALPNEDDQGHGEPKCRREGHVGCTDCALVLLFRELGV